jgi:hypothetical protein
MLNTNAKKLARALLPLGLTAICAVALGQQASPPPNWGAPGTTPNTQVAPQNLAPVRTLAPPVVGAAALPAGSYHLTLAFTSPAKSASENVTVTRNGTQISINLGSNVLMTGTVAANGAMTSSLSQQGAQVQLTGTASGRTASGQVTVTGSGHSSQGTFTLGAPTPTAHMAQEGEDVCGVWCQLMQIIHCIASAGTDC